MMVAAFVIQEDTVFDLFSQGLAVFHGKTHKRAISGQGNIGSFDEGLALRIYDQIESHLSVAEEYKRGYEQSEALITLKRTPDNTLPIFWSRKDKDGTKWPAPFPRS